MLCSAFLLTLPALAQESAAPEARYSLVSAQAADSVQSPIPLDCPADTVCVDNLSFGSFVHAKTLSGPDVGETFGAAIVTHLRLRDQQMLMIVEHRHDGSKQVRSFSRAAADGGRTCISRVDFEEIGFVPSGPGIDIGDIEVCAITSPVAPMSLTSTAIPIRAVGAADVQRPGKGGLFSLVPADGSGPVILALIEMDRGYPNGDWYCPPDPDENSICLGASIVIHPGTVLRRYGGSANVDPDWRATKFKQIGPHAARWVEGGRWLAVIEQTDEDYYYIQWKADASRGRFCMPAGMIEHYKLEAKPDFKLNDAGERCYAVRLSDPR